MSRLACPSVLAFRYTRRNQVHYIYCSFEVGGNSSSCMLTGLRIVSASWSGWVQVGWQFSSSPAGDTYTVAVNWRGDPRNLKVKHIVNYVMFEDQCGLRVDVFMVTLNITQKMLDDMDRQWVYL